jgi:sodium/potassium-transporting ATPase subunit alpha
MGVVVSTGDSTVFGRIAKLTNAPKTGMTPLEKEVLNFVLIICSIMFSMIIVVIAVWYVASYVHSTLSANNT